MKKLIPIALLVLLLGLVAFRFIRNSMQVEEEIPATPVRISTPVLGDIQMRLSYNGNLRPERTTVVTPLIAGEILEFHVDEGDLVQQGQLLVSLDDEIVSIQAQQAEANWVAADALLRKSRQGARPEELDSARASLAQAESDLEGARADLERSRNLFEAGTIPQAEFEDAENAVQAAQTELENARRSVRIMEEGARSEDIEAAQAQAQAALRQWDLARLQQDYADITAPVGGRVIDIFSDEGNTAAPGNPLLAIVSDALISAKIAVPERHYGLFQSQREIIVPEIYPIAYSDDDPFRGFLTGIAEVVNAETRTFEVDIAVENRSDLLKPGMFVTVDFLLSQVNDVVQIPSSAVIFRNGGPVVFTYDSEQGTVSMIEVQTGLDDGEFVQIVSGIRPEMPVVVEGNSFLEHGQNVRPVN